MTEEFITLKPKSFLLQSVISYYYFHTSLNTKHNKKFIYYPNFKNALTIYKNSIVVYDQNKSISKPSFKEDFSFLYSGIQKKIRTAEMIAPFNKIGVVFQELGINHFIEKSLSNITNQSVDKSFNYFGDELVQLSEQVYSQKNFDSKVELLDSFFLKKYTEFKDDRLKKSIRHILDSKKITVKEVSKLCKISEKTLLRIFKEHLCCTPKTYIDIVQFRKALNDYLLLERQSSFTKLAIDNEYYDQAQFINHFKKLTNVTPKVFFKKIKHLGYEDTFWTFK